MTEAHGSAKEMTRSFLKTLIGGIEDDWWFYLWSLREQEKRSWWFRCQDWELATCKAQELNQQQHHVYVGVGLSRKAGSPHERITAQQVEGISALWAEIDYGASGHKKTDLPPDELEALAVLDSMPLTMSLAIRSGGGLYGWWLFKELWVLDSDSERKLAAETARGWNVLAVRQARAKNYGADNVGDLARVLRVPGTTNWKYDPPRPCEVMPERWQAQTISYVPADFEMYSLAGLPAENHIGPEIVIASDEKLSDQTVALLLSSRKFKQTWEKRRTDLADTSQSGYDWEVAFLLVEEEWNDQQIADTLCGFRRQHGAKKVHPSYYRRTIAGARDRSQRGGRGVPAQEHDAIVSLISAVQASTPDPSDNNFMRLLATLSAKLGSGRFKVLRGVRYEVRNGASYQIWLEDTHGRIKKVGLGGCDGITNQDRCRQSIFDVTGMMMPRIKKGWDLIAEMIWTVCEKEVIYEATDDGQSESWLTAYLESRVPDTNRDEATRSRWPWREGEKVFFFLDNLRHWLKFDHGVNVSPRELGVMLRNYGCTSTKVNVEVDNVRTTRCVWEYTQNNGELLNPLIEQNLARISEVE